MNKNILLFLGGLIVIGVTFYSVSFFNKSGGKTQTGELNIISEKTASDYVCDTFPKEFVSSALVKNIIKIEARNSAPTFVCQYYTDESNFVTLRLNKLSVENQKKGQTTFGRTISTNDKIKIDHFVVIQEDGLINSIYLIINPNLFIVVDRTSSKAASEEDIVNFAVKVAERMQSEYNINTVPTSAATLALQGEDIVKNFFTLIGEGKNEDAVEMMSSSDSEKQAWGVQFNAFKKIDVKKIESSGKNTYKVTLNVEMKPESADTPIPFYGYDKGENMRWVSLEKVDNIWKIINIATGP